jgi:hypothetical protein
MRGSSAKNGPEYSSAGVRMDYYLADDKQAVSLEIYNDQNELVRSYVGGQAEPSVNTERDMSTEFSKTPASSGLPHQQGMNQFNWNMRHRSGWNKNKKRAYRGSGPMVRTGTYKAVLKVGDLVQEKSFQVLLDPRVSLVSDEDVAQQELLALELRDFQDNVNQLINAIDEERKLLKTALDKEKVNKKAQQRKAALDRVYYKLVTSPGTYQQPMLQAQTSYLNSMIGRADQKPGQDAYDRLEDLKNQFEVVKSEFEDLQ